MNLVIYCLIVLTKKEALDELKKLEIKEAARKQVKGIGKYPSSSKKYILVNAYMTQEYVQSQ